MLSNTNPMLNHHACCIIHNLINKGISDNELSDNFDEIDLNLATTEGWDLNYNLFTCIICMFVNIGSFQND